MPLDKRPKVIDMTEDDPAPKRARPAPVPPAGAVSSMVDSQPSANFSDSEDEETGAFKPGVDWSQPGYDFSGCPAADAHQPTCGLCGGNFEVGWHDAVRPTTPRREFAPSLTFSVQGGAHELEASMRSEPRSAAPFYREITLLLLT